MHRSLESIFKAFEGLKVLILGDVMVDSYIWGKVDRISPEAPVPIVLISKREKRLGGAGNVALNIQAMGAVPILCSMIGDDAESGILLDLMKKKGLSNEGLLKSKNRITTLKERVISGSQHILRVDSETDQELTEIEENELLSQIKKFIPDVDVIIFQDYDKGNLNKNIINQVINFARQHQVPTIVDPKKKNFLHYYKATLFKPNLKELREGLKLDFNSGNMEEIKEAVSQLREKLNLENTLITLSEKGVYMDSKEGSFHLPAHVRSISDVSGAGDTVICIAALCTALQLSPKFTAGLSNLAGGLVCEHVGVVPIDKKSLYEEAENNGLLTML
ncbi:D-glycero-beta-D-manno-heptose-7-phosphate kinase [soil metagenome]